MRDVRATIPKLWELITALMSPVSPRENGVSGTHWERPPPAAPPLTFMVGPPEGCLMVAMTFLPFFPSPWVRPIVVVDFPSPNGVGEMAGTSTYLPLGLPASRLNTLA